MHAQEIIGSMAVDPKHGADFVPLQTTAHVFSKQAQTPSNMLELQTKRQDSESRNFRINKTTTRAWNKTAMSSDMKLNNLK